MLPPMGMAQCAIAWESLRYVRRRFGVGATAVTAIGFLCMGAFFGVGVLAEFARFAAPLARLFGWQFVDFSKLVTFLWCFSSTPAILLYYVTRFALARTPVEHQPDRRKLIANMGKVAVAAPFVITAYGATVGRTAFKVEEVQVPVKDLPQDLSNLRIVQLSDLHLGPFLSESELARIIDAANELRPDIAVVTGDFISSHVDPVDIALKQCSRLRAQRILGCLGNHERYADLEDYVGMHSADHNINMLRSQSETLRFGSAEINFGGVDYQAFQDRDHYLDGAASLVRPGMVNVLLSHNPDVFPVAAKQGWDVTLSGHTHGGQVTVEILNQTLNLARMYTRYVSGLYRHGTSACYVTRGIGTIGIPARIGAPPEITLIRLVKGSSV